MTKNRDMENWCGQMEENTLDNGIMENSMVKESILLLMDKKDKENGKMKKEQSGYQEII